MEVRRPAPYDIALETLHLTFNIERETSEVDWRTGTSIPAHESKKTFLRMLREVQVRKLQQGFLVEGEVDRGQFDTERLGEKTRAAVIDWIPKRRI